MFTSTCIMCGKEFTQDEPAICIFTGSSRCTGCYGRAAEYRGKKDYILSKFAQAKELLLRPLNEKVDTELFLLDSEYLKGKESTR